MVSKMSCYDLRLYRLSQARQEIDNAYAFIRGEIDNLDLHSLIFREFGKGTYCFEWCVLIFRSRKHPKCVMLWDNSSLVLSKRFPAVFRRKKRLKSVFCALRNKEVLSHAFTPHSSTKQQ